MTDFPSELPAPLLAPYAVANDAGRVGVKFERGNTRRRKAASRESRIFTLQFIFTMSELWIWQSWANQYGYSWHTMDLESSYSGLTIEGLYLIPHSVRYISDISQTLLAPDLMQVSVLAELDATSTPSGGLVPSGLWYVGGTPAAPATDTITGGTPAAPAANNIIGGSPSVPAA